MAYQPQRTDHSTIYSVRLIPFEPISQLSFQIRMFKSILFYFCKIDFILVEQDLDYI